MGRPLFAVLVLALVAASSGAAGVSAVAGPPHPTAAPKPATWHLLALGDSIPYGGRYCGYCTPYPTVYGRSITAATGHPVVVTNGGILALTTAQLLTNVRTRSDVRRWIAAADIVTITIGHNDTPWNSRHDSCDGARAFFGPYNDARWSVYTGPCLAVEVSRFKARLGAILAEIRDLRGGRPTLIAVTTDYSQVIGAPGGPDAAPAASKAVLDRLAAVTCSAAAAYGARCVNVYHAFNGLTGTRDAGAFLAADHDHPSQKGHARIAALMGTLGLAPLDQ